MLTDESFREQTIDRARRIAGENHNSVKMNEFYKKHDDSRLVHYEGVCHTPEYRDRISDVESWMYLPPKEVEEYLKNNPDKPFMECEYMHDMGNSDGGMGSYISLLDKYPQYFGGFIWDFIDQALLVKDPVSGQEVMPSNTIGLYGLVNLHGTLLSINPTP